MCSGSLLGPSLTQASFWWLVGGLLCHETVLRQGGCEVAVVSEGFQGCLRQRGLLSQDAGRTHLSPAALEAGSGGPGAGRSDFWLDPFLPADAAFSPCPRGGQSELWSLFPCKGTNPITRTPPQDLLKARPPNPVPLGVWAATDGWEGG